MCEQRWKTRDRLLEYDINVENIEPNPIILNNVFPWDNLQLSVLGQQLYMIAANNGYTGTRDTFLERFALGSEPNFVVCDTRADFPAIGSIATLYLDHSTSILYYAISTATLDAVLLERIGGFIGTEENHLYYCYIPVRALPIEDIILNGGGA